eukprot:6094099-Prymnesium_polylepis.1
MLTSARHTARRYTSENRSLGEPAAHSSTESEHAWQSCAGDDAMDAPDRAAMQDAQGPQDGDGPERPQPIGAGGDERQVADARLW